MKRYEYRLLCLQFDKNGNMSPHTNEEVDDIRPGERVFKVLKDPEFVGGSDIWYLSVLLERETTDTFAVGALDRDELTAILKGDV